jgi:hypothetical protein
VPHNAPAITTGTISFSLARSIQPLAIVSGTNHNHHHFPNYQMHQSKHGKRVLVPPNQASYSEANCGAFTRCITLKSWRKKLAYCSHCMGERGSLEVTPGFYSTIRELTAWVSAGIGSRVSGFQCSVRWGGLVRCSSLHWLGWLYHTGANSLHQLLQRHWNHCWESRRSAGCLTILGRVRLLGFGWLHLEYRTAWQTYHMLNVNTAYLKLIVMCVWLTDHVHSCAISVQILSTMVQLTGWIMLSWIWLTTTPEVLGRGSVHCSVPYDQKIIHT